jgi:hypothetical protein
MLEKGYDSIAETARALFREGTEEPAYISIQKEKLATAKSPEEKVKAQIDKENMREAARERAKLDKLEYFCRKVGGVCTTDGYCEFNMFVEDPGELIIANKLREPIENMNDKSWEGQYFSSWASDKTAESRRSRIMEIGKKQKNLQLELLHGKISRSGLTRTRRRRVLSLKKMKKKMKTRTTM